MASYPEAQHAEDDDEGSDGSDVFEPSTVLSLLAQFVGDPASDPDGEAQTKARERVGALLWDMSAAEEHAAAVCAHASALVGAASREAASFRVRCQGTN